MIDNLSYPAKWPPMAIFAGRGRENKKTSSCFLFPSVELNSLGVYSERTLRMHTVFDVCMYIYIIIVYYMM